MVMTITDIANTVANAFLSSYDEGQESNVKGSNVYSTRNARSLHVDRPAVVTVSDRRGMLTLRFAMAGFGFAFTMFAEDATEERVVRVIDYYMDEYMTKLAEWQG